MNFYKAHSQEKFFIPSIFIFASGICRDENKWSVVRPQFIVAVGEKMAIHLQNAHKCS